MYTCRNGEKKMILDVTGIQLIPGNMGKDCPGNGNHLDEKGLPIECCCDECDYYLCCLESHTQEDCKNCFDRDCPQKNRPLV